MYGTYDIHFITYNMNIELQVMICRPEIFGDTWETYEKHYRQIGGKKKKINVHLLHGVILNRALFLSRILMNIDLLK